MGREAGRDAFVSMKVCRNTRCAFFFFIDYKNRFIFFKLRYFEEFFEEKALFGWNYKDENVSLS